MSAPDVEIIPLDGGELRFWPRLLGGAESRRWFDTLHDETAWEQSCVRIAGRSIAIPRLNAWYGDVGADYGYSGVRLTTRAWTPLLMEIKSRVERAAGLSFNSALINLYRDERDSVDWHADDEAVLGPDPQVASLSLGETRRFEVRRKDDHRNRLKLDLGDGSLLVMAGSLQHHWQHRVGKERVACGRRINITFRSICRTE